MATAAVQTIQVYYPPRPSTPVGRPTPKFEDLAVHVRDAFVLSCAIAQRCVARCEGTLFAKSNKTRSNTPLGAERSSAQEEFGLWVVRRIFEPISRFLQVLSRESRLYKLAASSAHNFFRVLGLFMRTVPLAQFFQQVILPYYYWCKVSRVPGSHLFIGGTMIKTHAPLLKYAL